MREYQLLDKGLFESTSKFEKKLNTKSLEGWKVISLVFNGGTLVALLEKEKQH